MAQKEDIQAAKCERPIWYDVIKYKTHKALLEKAQRKTLLKVASAYRTAPTSSKEEDSHR